MNKGKQSVVKHMLAIDWKFWRSYIKPSSARSITIQMLGRVAGSLILLNKFILVDITECMLSCLHVFYITR